MLLLLPVLMLCCFCLFVLPLLFVVALLLCCCCCCCSHTLRKDPKQVCFETINYEAASLSALLLLPFPIGHASQTTLLCSPRPGGQYRPQQIALLLLLLLLLLRCFAAAAVAVAVAVVVGASVLLLQALIQSSVAKRLHFAVRQCFHFV